MRKSTALILALSVFIAASCVNESYAWKPSPPPPPPITIPTPPPPPPPPVIPLPPFQINNASFLKHPGTSIESARSTGCISNSDVLQIRGTNVNLAKSFNVDGGQVTAARLPGTSDCNLNNCFALSVTTVPGTSPGQRTVALTAIDGRVIRTNFQVTPAGNRCDVPAPNVPGVPVTQQIPPPPMQLPPIKTPPPIQLPPIKTPPPIVLPLPPPAPRKCTTGCDVNRNDRALIFLNNTAAAGDRNYQLLYQFLERSGKAVVSAELGPMYKNIIALEGANATSGNFKQRLAELENDPKVKAIDLVISLHGNPNNILFQDTEMPVSNLAADITNERVRTCRGDQACINQKKQKLRVVYSAACFGESHLDGWLAAGFDAAAGSHDVHTDSAASFPTFMNTWRSGYSFAESVNRANSADRQRKYDAWARSINRDWSSANSQKSVKGNSNVDPGRLMIWTK